MVHEFPARLPRHAFSPRDAARAADLWRLCQEVATDGSSAVGWPPSRYRAEGLGFVVREMTCVHFRETPHGEPLRARTWVRDFRRGMLTNREIRVDGPGGPLVSATQEWVHVKADPERKNPDAPPLKPARASPELVAAFVAPAAPEAPAEWPAFDAITGAVHEFRFECWQTWMDPLAHANHPMYVDWSDEALSRAMLRVGLDPVGLVPRAERVRWKTGIVAGDVVDVTTKAVGRTATGDAVIDVEIKRRGELAATATLIRGLHGGTGDALLAALR